MSWVSYPQSTLGLMRSCLLGLGGHTDSYAFKVFCFRKVFNWSMNKFLILHKVTLSHKMQWQYKRNSRLLQSKHCLSSYLLQIQSLHIAPGEAVLCCWKEEQGIYVSISGSRWSLHLALTSIWRYFRLQKSIKGKKLNGDFKKQRKKYIQT